MFQDSRPMTSHSDLRISGIFSSTGQTAAVPIIESSGDANVTLLKEVAVSGEPHAAGILTAGSRSTGSSQAVSTGLGGRSRVKPVEPRIKHAIRSHFAAYLENIRRAMDETSDFFLRNNALEQSRSSLGNLWNLRNSREEQFAAAINMLQSLFLKRGVEEFANDQLGVLYSVVEKLRDESLLTDAFVSELAMELLNGGLDVFREIE